MAQLERGRTHSWEADHRIMKINIPDNLCQRDCQEPWLACVCVWLPGSAVSRLMGVPAFSLDESNASCRQCTIRITIQQSMQPGRAPSAAQGGFFPGYPCTPAHAPPCASATTKDLLGVTSRKRDVHSDNLHRGAAHACLMKVIVYLGVAMVSPGAASGRCSHMKSVRSRTIALPRCKMFAVCLNVVVNKGRPVPAMCSHPMAALLARAKSKKLSTSAPTQHKMAMVSGQKAQQTLLANAANW